MLKLRDRHAPLAMTDNTSVARNEGQKHSIPRTLGSSTPVGTAYSLTTRNYITDMNTPGWIANDGAYMKEEVGTGWFRSEKVRLFPNDSRIRFEGPVHEFVENSLHEAGFEIRKCDVPIHHYGKLDMEKVKEKGEQYYELGKSKAVEEGEENLLAIHELATQASELGKYEESLDYWKTLLKLKPDVSAVLYGIANAYYKMNQFEESRSAAAKAVTVAKEHTEWRDAVILFAYTAILTEKSEECLRYLEQLRVKEPGHHIGLFLLTIASFFAGEKHRSIEYLEYLTQRNFASGPFFVYFARTFIDTNRVPRALSLLEFAKEHHAGTPEINALIDECQRIA